MAKLDCVCPLVASLVFSFIVISWLALIFARAASNFTANQSFRSSYELLRNYFSTRLIYSFCHFPMVNKEETTELAKLEIPLPEVNVGHLPSEIVSR